MAGRQILDEHGLTYITCTIVGWIDLFTRPVYRDIVIDSLRFCQTEKGLQIFAYVLTSNHLHLIVKAKDEDTLSKILHDFRKHTGKSMLKEVQEGNESRKEWLLHQFQYYAKINSNNRSYHIWERDNYPTALVTPPVIWQKIDYIHHNPVRNKLVDNPCDYLYSSARNYFSEPSTSYMSEVDLIEPFLPKSGFTYIPAWEE